MTPRKMRPKPYNNRPKNGKASTNGEQLSNFDTPRYENTKPRLPNGNRNYQQLFDKYMNLAKEALSGGDRVAAEFHYQYADHYLRLMNERQTHRPDHDRYKRSENADGAVSNNHNAEESNIPPIELSEENIVEPIEEGTI